MRAVYLLLVFLAAGCSASAKKSPGHESDVPQNFRAESVSRTTVDLAWDLSSQSIDGLTLERSPYQDTGYDVIADIASGNRVYADAELQPGTVYFYRLRSYSGDTFSSYSEVLECQTATDSVVPNAPESLSFADVTSNSLTLSWVDCSDNESGFIVERSTSFSLGFEEIATCAENCEQFVDSGLNPLVAYYYRVKAYNSKGESFYSSTVSVTTLDGSGTVPLAPDSLSFSDISQTQIAVSWTDRSLNEDGFILQRSVSSSSGFTTIATLKADLSSFVDSGLSGNTAYYYRVCSYNAAGSSAYSEIRSASTVALGSSRIIADHSVVSRYAAIPDRYITAVKSMLFNIPGESHGAGYREGCVLLQNIDSRFAVEVSGTQMLGASTQYLRISDVYRNAANTGWNTTGGEEDFWTTPAAVAMMKQHLTYMRSTAGNPVSVFGFAWCYDMTSNKYGLSDLDTVYGVRWYGRAVRLDGGETKWFGLDSDDSPISMQTYINAVEAYRAHDPLTVTVFTTSPVDESENTGESGYQRALKNKYIRDYVNSHPGTVLFDYADIECWSDAGVEATAAWSGNTFQVIHPDNLTSLTGDADTSVGHIGQTGALRLGKSLWWMLARIAGWDGVSK